MNHSPEDHVSDSSRTPLISIGLVMIIILMVPVLLYSVGPEGPLKVGDVVFATDRHHVVFVDATLSHTQGYQDFCILEPRVQLVVQKIEHSSGGLLVGEPIAIQENDVPFCPSRTPILLHPHQITLKADIWGELRDMVQQVF